jgi:hypothetical protein
MQPSPKEIWIEPRHRHVVEIKRSEGSKPPREDGGGRVFAIDKETSVDITPNTSVPIIGTGLGVEELKVTLNEGAEKAVARLRVRGVSQRVTVVAWVDRDSVKVQELARNASRDVIQTFAHHDLCMQALLQLSRATKRHWPKFAATPADRRYTEAMLIKGSHNRQPPSVITSDYVAEGDFRLLNDFRVTREGGHFVIVGGKDSRVGNTPSPCQDLAAGFWEAAEDQGMRRMMTPEPHKMNDRRWENNTRVVQVNEGRIGAAGQRVQRLLGDRPDAVDPTPYIWSVISIDSRGTIGLDHQMFPSYSVFIDGIQQAACERPAANLQNFLALDHNSEFTIGRGIDSRRDRELRDR